MARVAGPPCPGRGRLVKTSRRFLRKVGGTIVQGWRHHRRRSERGQIGRTWMGSCIGTPATLSCGRWLSSKKGLGRRCAGERRQKPGGRLSSVASKRASAGSLLAVRARGGGGTLGWCDSSALGGHGARVGLLADTCSCTHMRCTADGRRLWGLLALGVRSCCSRPRCRARFWAAECSSLPSRHPFTRSPWSTASGAPFGGIVCG